MITDVDGPVEAVSLDLFGTLVTVERPADPAARIGAELAARGVSVPDGWRAAYARPHVDAPEGGEVPLSAHVAAALASRSDAVDRERVRPDAAAAVRAAFDIEVRTRPGAGDAVAALAARRPTGVLSNCSVAGLAERVIDRSGVDRDALDAVVTSVGCGWRKPDPRAFEAVADALGAAPDRLLHVGDDPATDGGAEAAGATSRLVGTEENGRADLRDLASRADGSDPTGSVTPADRGEP